MTTKRLCIALLSAVAGLAPLGAIAQDLPGLSKLDGINDLMSIVQTQGAVRVIVELKVPGYQRPTPSMDALSEMRQQTNIASSQQSVLQALSGSGISAVTTFNHLPMMAMTVDQKALTRLQADPSVIRVLEDGLNRPYLPQSIPHIDADVVHDAGVTGLRDNGAPWVVAVLDTGIDKAHPFIGAARVAVEACFGTTDPVFYNSTTMCPSPNGDGDAFGLNTGEDCPASVIGCDHGTHVGGIAAGSQSGGPRFGMANGGRLAAVQVFSRFPNEAQCGVNNTPCALAFDSDVLKALEWVYDERNTYPFASVNLSLGGGAYSTACAGDPRAAISQSLRDAGIAVVAAAGNDGFSSFIGAPACVPAIISVGDTNDQTDALAPWTNRADILDLWAPGHMISSSVPGATYSDFGGTSMASPHVAGAFALLRQIAPDRSVDSLLDDIADTGVPINDGNRIRPRLEMDAAATRTAQQNARIGQVSTRALVGTDPEIAIGGFIISGNSPRQVLIRGRGPTVGGGIPQGDRLQNPMLRLFSGSTLLATNNDWGAAPNAGAISATGLAPTNASESAILVTLDPGPYTAHLLGVSGGTGTGIVEVFERNPGNPNAGFGRVVNLSTRGFVGTGDDIMIGGIIVYGDSPRLVLLRGRGPSLGGLPAGDKLQNPMLRLFSGQTLIAQNANWGSASNAGAIAATGMAPSNANEAAILISLAPGAYTAQVLGEGGTTGIGIVEAIEVLQ